MVFLKINHKKKYNNKKIKLQIINIYIYIYDIKQFFKNSSYLIEEIILKVNFSIYLVFKKRDY
jgi:hypothetical protein